MALSTAAHSVYKKESVIRGHHVYKKCWTPVTGEVLPVEREENNQHDQYAVAVTRMDISPFRQLPFR